MIKLSSISKVYNYRKHETKALDDINLQIVKGEMVAIMGPSGSGKTTILNIIGGIVKQTAGEYLFNEKAIPNNESELAKFRNDNIGFILQNFALINNRNVFYNISLPLMYKGFTKATIQEQVLSVAQSLGIPEKLEMYPHMLSGGECQRVAIARAIIGNPKVVLADEPTCSLDEDNKCEVMNILKSLNANGVTVVTATHDNNVGEICDRIVNIKNNRISQHLNIHTTIR